MPAKPDTARTPRTPAKGRYQRLTRDTRRRFLRALARGLSVQEAAEAAGVERRQTLYELRARSPRFAEAWERAWRSGDEALAAAEKAESDRFQQWLVETAVERQRQRARGASGQR